MAAVSRRIAPLIPLDPSEEVLPCGTEGCKNAADRVCSICSAALCAAEYCKKKWRDHLKATCVRLETQALLDRYSQYVSEKDQEHDGQCEAAQQKLGGILGLQQIQELGAPQERVERRWETIVYLDQTVQFNHELCKTGRAIHKILQAREDMPQNELEEFASYMTAVSDRLKRYKAILKGLLEDQKQDRNSI